MAAYLEILLVIIPWSGALVTWLTGDDHPRALPYMAAGFSLLTGLISVLLLPLSSANIVVNINIGGMIGAFTFLSDALRDRKSVV